MRSKQKSADGMTKITECGENNYVSGMTDRQQTEILERYFSNCLDFWKHQGKNEEEARNMALDELRRVKGNPFTPRLRPMAPDIVAKVAAKYEKQL